MIYTSPIASIRKLSKMEPYLHLARLSPWPSFLHTVRRYSRIDLFSLVLVRFPSHPIPRLAVYITVSSALFSNLSAQKHHLQTITLFLGAIVGIVLFVRRISEFVNATKASYVSSLHPPISSFLTSNSNRLQEKGWTVSNQGVSVRTSKRLDREDYIDATQRYARRSRTDVNFLLILAIHGIGAS